MATGENVEGENLIAKAGRKAAVRKQRQQSKSKSSSEGGEEWTGEGEGDKGGGNSPLKAKRAQYCTICKNHNQRVLKKRHKCPHSDCQCPLCQLSRRVQCIMCHQQRLWRFRKSMEKNGFSQNSKDVSHPTAASPSSSSSSVTEGDSRLQESLVDDPSSVTDPAKPNTVVKPERNGKQQVCDKCRNHDEWVLKRGHKGKCPYESCTCQYCSFTIKRRNLMKHQQRVRRAQVTSQPIKGNEDYDLQPCEASADQQREATPPMGDLSNDKTQREVPENIVSHNDIQECTSPPREILTGPSQRYEQETVQKVSVITVEQNNMQAVWQKCSKENSPTSTTSSTRGAYEVPHEASIPLVKSDRAHEQCISPKLPQGRCISQAGSPRINHEPSLSPAMPQKTSIASEMIHDQHFLPVNCSKSKISPTMSNETLVLPTLSQEPRISQTSYYRPKIPSVTSNEPRTSLANIHSSDASHMTSSEINTSTANDQEQMFPQMLSHQKKYSLPNGHEPVYCQSLFHEQKFSQVMSPECRISSSVYNEPPRDSIPFPQESVVNQGAEYASLTDEAVPSPLNYFKQEPVTDDNMLYDNMETAPIAADYTEEVDDYNSGMNYVNDTEIHLQRQASLPKFGVETNDLQLREWAPKRATRPEQPYSDPNQTSNVRGTSLCRPLSHTQELLLSQNNNTVNQQHYYPGMTNTSPSTYESPLLAYGWGTNAPQLCTTTPRSHSSEIVQSQHAVIPMPNCEAFAQNPLHHSQALWWQQAQTGSLE